MFDQILHANEPGTRAMIFLIALGFMALEYWLGRLAHHDAYDLAESAASLGVALGHKLVRALEASVLAIPFVLLYEHRIFEFDSTTLPALLALFLATEFLYYWQHRAAHRVRWMWATHAVHHTATRLNLTAAIRLGWTGTISGSFLFFLPLVWLGFHPVAVVGMLGINLLYQFFIHTGMACHLGPLEWVLNTPAHHRVHHASNATCLDKNYGGMLIVFDRLFGTFARPPEHEALRFGLVGVNPSLNPLRIAFGEWLSMLRDVRAASTWTDRFRALFAPPGTVAPRLAQPSDRYAAALSAQPIARPPFVPLENDQ